MGSGRAHRGSAGNMLLFAQRFVDGRMAGFNKDMEICLTPKALIASRRPTHAYFPALAACCGTMEYLTALYVGDTRRLGWTRIARWAEKFMVQPDYDRETVRILFLVFRNPVAHRGIASGVWVDEDRGAGGYGRRMTWRVLADWGPTGCEVTAEAGMLERDSPWKCPYTHRVRVHLKRLWHDIRDAAGKYQTELTDDDGALVAAFEECMRRLYPTAGGKQGQ